MCGNPRTGEAAERLRHWKNPQRRHCLTADICKKSLAVMNTAFNGSFSSFQRMWQSVIKVLEVNAPEERRITGTTVMPSVWPGGGWGLSVGLLLGFNQVPKGDGEEGDGSRQEQWAPVHSRILVFHGCGCCICRVQCKMGNQTLDTLKASKQSA